MSRDEMNGSDMNPNDLDRDERELRDDALGRQLRTALTHEQAPEAWVRDALAAPRRPAEVPAALPEREEPWILAILPQLCGLALMIGLAISLWMHPDLIDALANYVGSGVIRVEGEAASSVLLLVAAVATPALALLMVEGSRGFPLVKRWIASAR